MSFRELTSREAVLSAIKEYDRVGQRAFLSKYDRGPSKTYYIIHAGKSYDSKAIVGAAYAYQFPERGPLKYFNGGVPVKKKLESLGFELRVEQLRPSEIWQVMNDDEADESIYQSDGTYIPNNDDERTFENRSIAVRRGQKEFRDKLRRRFSDTCVITGCRIVALLEAAHISPFRGDKDNDPSNGLLLKTDIHTLFDLNLLGIDPDDMLVKLSDAIQVEYSFLKDKQLRFDKNQMPNKYALEFKYQQFKAQNG